MSLSADALLDRLKLKSEINKWRTIAILIAVLLGFSVIGKSFSDSGGAKDYIARIEVDGIILEDTKRDEKLQVIRNNDNIKAVVVYINSPGGTIVGGEKIYNSLREISTVKPVVAVLGTFAASGGYMVAIGADKIFTSAGTMTGSIGVLMQTAEITDLAQKLGVNFITFKSGELKGSPSPMEKLNPNVAKVMQDSIDDGYEYFIGLVKDRRPLTEAEVRSLSDGRIYTGRQAVKNKLVDAIGGEKEAVEWLVKDKKIPSSLKVQEVPLKDKENPLEQFYSNVMGSNNPYIARMFPSGLMAMWNP
jgi:protease-4